MVMSRFKFAIGAKVRVFLEEYPHVHGKIGFVIDIHTVLGQNIYTVKMEPVIDGYTGGCFSEQSLREIA